MRVFQLIWQKQVESFERTGKWGVLNDRLMIGTSVRLVLTQTWRHCEVNSGPFGVSLWMLRSTHLFPATTSAAFMQRSLKSFCQPDTGNGWKETTPDSTWCSVNGTGYPLDASVQDGCLGCVHSQCADISAFTVSLLWLIRARARTGAAGKLLQRGWQALQKGLFGQVCVFGQVCICVTHGSAELISPLFSLLCH